MGEAQYIESKIDNKTYCKSNGQFARHLKLYNLTNKDYYETYITGVTPLCTCGKQLTYYRDGKYANSCGDSKCVGNSVSISKSKWSSEQKLSDSENKKKAATLKTDEQKQIALEKARQTFREKYGVDWGSKLDQQKEKSKQTKLEKYGDSAYNNSTVSAQKNKNKSVDEKNKINQKRRETNLDRFGVENTFLRSENIRRVNRGNASIKLFVFPSGKQIGVRGFEPAALTTLLNRGYVESELIVHNDYENYSIEVFQYVAENRHTAKYYPDIYIPQENKIIEVKSRWWWDGNGSEKYKTRLTNNLKKRQAVIDKGYIYELWLFEDKKNYKILINDSDFQIK